MPKFYLFLTLAFTALLSNGCSDTQGGAERVGDNGARQNARQDDASGRDSDQNARDGNRDDDTDDDGLGGGGDSDGRGDDVDGGDNTSNSGEFAEVCDFIKDQSFYNDVKDEYDFLCVEDGFETLAENRGKLKTVEDEQKNGLSYIAFAGSETAKSSLDAAEEISKVICEDFGEYKSLIGEESFKDVEAITPSGGDNGNCDFQFVGKRILFFQPSYRGKIKTIRTERFLVNAQYLTQKESLIEDSKSITISIKNGDSIEYYMIQSSVSDTKGFHNTTRDKVKAGMQKGVSSFSDALDRAEDRL